MTKQIVDITEAAVFHINEMMENNEQQGAYLRVSVKGGGCSGLTYAMGFDTEVDDEADEAYEEFGLNIVVAKQDIPVLNGTVIDFKQSLMGGGFTIDNPNAIASCGCGSSFRTAKNAGTPANC
ncbi:HesB/IscA family protein [Kurthia senegalensis]|uniref:HesB/IscA family protein n=1 Tax=Kurthia senegalensis TaxID=1033740 RepID=UPI0002890A8F|nr:iron-sulfur cluster assembly accessory protein [Kurthia senegalensis]